MLFGWVPTMAATDSATVGTTILVTAPPWAVGAAWLGSLPLLAAVVYHYEDRCGVRF